MNKTAYNAWINDYREALTQAAGIAYILGFSGHAKTLHELSCQAIGIDTTSTKRQKDIDEPRKMRYNVNKKQEGKTMKNNFTLADGCTIEIVSLGRDDGSEIIGRNSAGEIACYIATENTTRDRAEIVQAIKDGAKTLEQVFDMWENGLGGNPFNLDYLSEYYK